MKIVIRGTNWIGDAVMTIPAMRELRGVFPDAHITLNTRSWAEGIFRDADFIDAILPYEQSESDLKDVIEQSQVLKAEKFDVAVLFPNSFASALTMRFAAVPHRFGYSREARRFFLTHPVKVPAWKNERHEVFYYLNLAAEVERELLGTDTITGSLPELSVAVSAERRENARMILAEAGLNLKRPTVALGVGSTNSRAKRWLPENFAALNDMLESQLHANVVIMGSKEEAAVAKEVFELSRLKPVMLAGRTTLDEAVAILSEADLLISNDMGLAHVAPAVGTDTLVIFGPTNPETTRPFSERAKVIRVDVECSPCMLRDCPIDHRCMTRISPGSVFDAAQEALAGAKRYAVS